MFARVNYFEGPREKVGEAVRFARREVLPTGRKLEGFRGMEVLLDRKTGKTMVITLWESEEAMRASEEEAQEMRGRSATELSQRIAGVERYELGLLEVYEHERVSGEEQVAPTPPPM